MNVAILIPARFQSSRYPGKPLVELRGASGVAKPLIQRSYEAALRVAGAPSASMSSPMTSASPTRPRRLAPA